VNFSHPKKDVINIELHHGARKNVATLRTVRTLINNMIIGVTKGFKYKMRYVYAHFPINVNVDQNAETGLYEVEIRNFIGEKIVRKVVMHEGVEVEASKNQKDELQLTGNSLENVSQSAADIQQICRVRNKDIRKVRSVPCSQPAFFFFFPLPMLISPTVLGRSLRLGEGQRRRGGLDAKTGSGFGVGFHLIVTLSRGGQGALLHLR
jgi:large subunit ribosomal protein L9e